jgi:hypothetical protein
VRFKALLPVDLADEDHSVEEVDVALGKPAPVLDQDVQLPL